MFKTPPKRYEQIRIAPRRSEQACMFGLVFFAHKSLMGNSGILKNECILFHNTSDLFSLLLLLLFLILKTRGGGGRSLPSKTN